MTRWPASTPLKWGNKMKPYEIIDGVCVAVVNIFVTIAMIATLPIALLVVGFRLAIKLVEDSL
jgi:hypothetical protein